MRREVYNRRPVNSNQDFAGTAYRELSVLFGAVVCKILWWFEMLCSGGILASRGLSFGY